jgi:hypothetical protein
VRVASACSAGVVVIAPPKVNDWNAPVTVTCIASSAFCVAFWNAESIPDAILVHAASNAPFCTSTAALIDSSCFVTSFFTRVICAFTAASCCGVETFPISARIVAICALICGVTNSPSFAT